jgi:hypothetical protein
MTCQPSASGERHFAQRGFGGIPKNLLTISQASRIALRAAPDPGAARRVLMWRRVLIHRRTCTRVPNGVVAAATRGHCRDMERCKRTQTKTNKRTQIGSKCGVIRRLGGFVGAPEFMRRCASGNRFARTGGGGRGGKRRTLRRKSQIPGGGGSAAPAAAFGRGGGARNGALNAICTNEPNSHTTCRPATGYGLGWFTRHRHDNGRRPPSMCVETYPIRSVQTNPISQPTHGGFTGYRFQLVCGRKQYSNWIASRNGPRDSNFCLDGKISKGR